MALFKSNSVEETLQIAENLAKNFTGGEIVFLQGDLAAGKTAFSSGIAQALGIHEPVTSPTFPIINEYHSGRLAFYHMDLYRLKTYEEFHHLGGEDYLYGDGVCVIEWPDILLNEKVAASMLVSITVDKDTQMRLINCEGDHEKSVKNSISKKKNRIT